MKSKIVASLLLAVVAFALPTKAQHKKIAMANQPVASALTADPGDLIATIEFQVQAEGEDAKVFTKGIIPWVNLQKADTDMKKMLNANEIVLPYTKVTVVTTYPQAATFILKAGQSGFSRTELVKAISDKVMHPAVDPKHPKPVATEATNLNLSTADVFETESGQIILKLQLES